MPHATRIPGRWNRISGFLFWSVVFLLGISQSPAAAQISTSDTLFVQIFFAHDSAALGAEIGKLDSLTILLQEKQDVVISLKGHASNTGSAEYNRRLVERRLTSVKDYLIGKGVAEKRIHSIVNGGIDYQSRAQKSARRVDLMAVIPQSPAPPTSPSHTAADSLSVETSAAPSAETEASAAPSAEDESESEAEAEGEGEGEGESAAKTDTATDTPAAASPACCPRLALRTNLLYDALLIPNIGVEFLIDPHWSVAANVMYTWMKNDPTHWYWRVFSTDLEGRYWFKGEPCGPRTGHHLGAYAGFYRYDFEFGGDGWMGDYNYGGGISYGYAIPIFPRSRHHFTLDMSLGLGYIGGTHKEYYPDAGCYVWQRTMRHNYFGPTKLEVTLVWYPGFINRKGGKP